MKLNIHKDGGFTLVELLVVIAIMGIIIMAISSFLISNIKIFHRADNQIEVQYNAQVAMNEMTEEIMEAKNIESIKIKDSSTYNGSYQTVEEIVFRLLDGQFMEFKYNAASKTLMRGKDNNSRYITTNQYANNIENFRLKLIGINFIDLTQSREAIRTELKKAKGIDIEIITDKGDSQVKIKNRIYFRNYRD